MARPQAFPLIADEIQKRIAQGSYRPGQALPSEQALAGEFGNSRNTVRKALDHLGSLGLIRSHAGKGHFISGDGSPEAIDIAIALRFTFSNWNPEAANGLFHSISLLEERVVSAGGRMLHIPHDLSAGGETLLAAIRASSARHVVVEMPVWPTKTESQTFARLLADCGKRVVILSWVKPDFSSPLSHIYVDWTHGATALTKHLLALGKRSVLYAGLDGITWSDHRRAGFLAAMHENGLWHLDQPPPCLPCPESSIEVLPNGVLSPSTFDNFGSQIAAWLTTHPVDAVICCNDALAKSLIEHSPRPMPLVVGFDNSQWARENQVISMGINHRLIAEALLAELKRDDPHDVARMIAIPTILLRR